MHILGTRIDTVTHNQVLESIERYIQSGTPHHVVTGNTLMLLEAEKDPTLRQILESAAIVVPESSGILWACRTMGVPLEDFLPGIDLMLSICRVAQQRGYPAFLVGSAPGVAERAKSELLQRYPGIRIVGTHHGYFKENDLPHLLSKIKLAKPSLLFVGLGMPAQEKWIARFLQTLQVPVVMGVGGSLDVISGKLSRAPSLLRKAGMEWLYRLVQEPWRWRRISQLPVFAWKVLNEPKESAHAARYS